MVGDKASDMRAAQAAGIPRRYQVASGAPEEGCIAVTDLPTACKTLLKVN